MAEIWVYSPEVEGVHLRFGRVARGGLRWSDRREDFRTEVLGLVKAQMVKNTVIVPVGSKGGFVLKRPPAAGDREALLEEGIACYQDYLRGLLDLTDNRVGDAIVPPPHVHRHDADDPYLVVAADKGTATFSDYANKVSGEYGFWLGDAFASGGSAGYDHKAMGITARGAWESVKRHFREMGVDTQATDFTAVGIGDMAREVLIVNGARTAIGDYGGALKDIPPTELGARVVSEALARAKVDPAQVGQCVFGNVIHTEAKDMAQRPIRTHRKSFTAIFIPKLRKIFLNSLGIL